MSGGTALLNDNLAEAFTGAICAADYTIHTEVNVIVDWPIGGCLSIESKKIGAFITPLNTTVVVDFNKFISNCDGDNVGKEYVTVNQ